MSEEHRTRDEELGIVPMSVEFRDALVADLRSWCDALTANDARPQVEPAAMNTPDGHREQIARIIEGAERARPRERWALTAADDILAAGLVRLPPGRKGFT